MLAAPTLAVLLGQACTNNLSFQTELPSLGITSESGNGGTYDGKLVIVHHVQEGFTCEGLQRPKAILLRRSNMQWYYTENAKEKCRLIDQQPVQGVTYDETTRIANYKNETYTPPQLFKVSASEDPNLSDLNLEDGICADENDLCSMKAAFDQIVPMNFAAAVEIFIPKGTYNLTSQITVTNENPIRITGEEKDATILDAGLNSRIFEMYATGPNGLGDLQISNLTFSRGRIAGTLSWGGAMMISYRNNNVKIENCHFEANRAEQAGGALSIHGGGTGVATVISSTFKDNAIFSTNPMYYRGDAIYASGSMILEDSMVHENGLPSKSSTVVDLNTKGPFWLKNSSVVNNQSTGTAYTVTSCSVAPCAVDNSTIAKNRGIGFGFAGGIDSNGKSTEEFFMHNATIAQNNQARGLSGVGNIWATNVAAFELHNSIVAVTDPAFEKNCSIVGNYVVRAQNIINDTSCPTSATQEPLLGPLMNNGGIGLTMKPLAGSPAIKTGAQCLPIDQRHVLRPSFATSCDMGAIEGP